MTTGVSFIILCHLSFKHFTTNTDVGVMMTDDVVEIYDDAITAGQISADLTSNGKTSAYMEICIVIIMKIVIVKLSKKYSVKLNTKQDKGK